MLKMLTFFKTREGIETNTVFSTNYTTYPCGFWYHSAEFAKSPPKTEVLPPVTVHALWTGPRLTNPQAAAQPLSLQVSAPHKAGVASCVWEKPSSPATLRCELPASSPQHRHGLALGEEVGGRRPSVPYETHGAEFILGAF